MSTNNDIYTGVWINHAKGSILGSTITVTPANGLLLVAVMALFVSLAGSQSWGIIAFFVHQIRATKQPQHGIFYQQQAVLRNTDSASSTVWQLGRIAWAWRSQGVHGLRRSIGLILLGATQLLLFTAAGILSSRLARGSNEVLTQSPNCGIWDASAGDQLSVETDSGVYVRTQTDRSRTYVQQCLAAEYESFPECTIYKKRELKFAMRTDAPCPFLPVMCAGPGNLAVELDTGLLDSRDDFGFNSRQMDRIQYRRVTTCSPILSDGYLTNGTSVLHGREYNYTAAFYGVNNVMNSSKISFGGVPNATYVHSHYRALETTYDADLSESPYIVATMVGYPLSPEAGITPIPSLFNPNGSTVLIFASFDNGIYSAPISDPWLSAHRPINQSYQAPGGSVHTATFYSFDNPISTLGCVEQHQVCNPNRKGSLMCTPLQSYDALNYTYVLDTKHQIMTADVITYSVAGAELQNLIPILPYPLLAADHLSHTISTGLPGNQWILEVANWFSIGLNVLQRSIAAVATGPPGFTKYTANGSANNTALQWFCANYVMRNNVYTSFSTLALSLVIGFGGLAICCNFWLESIAGFIQSKWRTRKGKKGKVGFGGMSWKLDSVLHYQRMAFEEVGLGSWERASGDIPILSGKEKVMVATEWDEWHPSIRGKEASVIQSPHLEGLKDGRVIVEVQETLSEVPTATSPTESTRQETVSDMEISEVGREDHSHGS